MPGSYCNAFMASWRGFLSVLLAVLVVHGSLLAVMPIVWCVGKHGHSALELCVSQACHGNAKAVPSYRVGVASDDVTKQTISGRSTHDHDNCLDTKPIDSFDRDSNLGQSSVSIPEPSIVPLHLRECKTTANAVFFRPRQAVRERPQRLAQLRSVVLLI